MDFREIGGKFWTEFVSLRNMVMNLLVPYKPENFWAV
jgi:hypothetical protein